MAITPEQLNDRDSAAAQQSCATRAPERVTDEELATIRRLVPESVAANEWYAEHGPLLAAEVRARREEAAAAHATLDKIGALTHMIGVGAPDMTPATLAERIEDVRGDFAGLAADLHKANEDDAAIGRLLDEAGVTSREGETLLERVERLVALSHDRMTRLLGADTRAEELRARAEKAET